MKKIILLGLALFLTGCSSMQSNPQPTFHEFGEPLGNHYLSWNNRQAQLSAIQNWNAQGNLAINTDQKGVNASFNWQQQNANYTIALFGPLGSNRVTLTGGPTQVTLQTPNQTFTAADPESLMQQQLGWSIPVSNLYYWLRGIPAPGVKVVHESLDMNKHLSQLSQQGWHIIYLRYLSVNGVDLPNRLLLSNSRVQLRVVITKWAY